MVAAKTFISCAILLMPRAHACLLHLHR